MLKTKSTPNNPSPSTTGKTGQKRNYKKSAYKKIYSVITPPSGPHSHSINVNSGSTKKRKTSNEELRLNSKSVQFSGSDSDDVSNGDDKVSCCSSNESILTKVKSSDLESEVETELRYNSDRRESTPTSKLNEEEKPPVTLESRREIPQEKKPPAAEIEEFFANAEKEIHNRFREKYNYDVVNDVPLKGRYEWIELTP